MGFILMYLRCLFICCVILCGRNVIVLNVVVWWLKICCRCWVLLVGWLVEVEVGDMLGILVKSLKYICLFCKFY